MGYALSCLQCTTIWTLIINGIYHAVRQPEPQAASFSPKGLVFIGYIEMAVSSLLTGSNLVIAQSSKVLCLERKGLLYLA